MTQEKHYNKTKRIAKNTLLLYSRMFIVLIVSLFTSRLILQILGATDFGIYSVVGGIVVIFNVLSASMSESTSRFFSYSIGKNDGKKLRGYFHNSKTVYILLGLITFLCSLIIGLLLINYKLKIPVERIYAAKIVLIFSTLAFVFKINNTPYTALIISNERMGFFASFGILEVFFKLFNVFILYIINLDHLIVYAALSLTEPVFNRIILSYYCNKNFANICKGKTIGLNKSLFREMIGFAGWDMLGAIERILQDQGVNIVINFFCLPAVNAARAIAMQIKNAVTQFTTNFQVAVNPQIVKTYAEGDREFMLSLIYRTCKFSFYLLLILICPIIAHTELILRLWLGKVPDHTILFVKLILILVLSDAFYEIMNQGAKATGDIKLFRILTSSVSILNLPISYFILSIGIKPEFTVIITILLNICVLLTQMLILKKKIGLDVVKFVKKVITPCYAIAIIFIPLCHYTGEVFSKSYLEVIMHIVISSIFLIAFVYLVGITKGEKNFVFNIIKSRLNKNNNI